MPPAAEGGEAASQICFWSGAQLAGAIRARTLPAAAALEAVLAQRDRCHPATNAVVVINADAARARAAAADAAAARGEWWGPLHGVPMTVKENISVAGLKSPTLGRLEASTDEPAAQSEPLVAKLLAAGAVVYGKTNLPVDVADWQSYNPVYGTCRNPWDLGRTPGGSSGGSAAALASGQTPLEVGGDIGACWRAASHGLPGRAQLLSCFPRHLLPLWSR